MPDEYDGEMMTYGGDGPDVDMDVVDDSAEMLDDGDMVDTDSIFE